MTPEFAVAVNNQNNKQTKSGLSTEEITLVEVIEEPEEREVAKDVVLPIEAPF